MHLHLGGCNWKRKKWRNKNMALSVSYVWPFTVNLDSIMFKFSFLKKIFFYKNVQNYHGYSLILSVVQEHFQMWELLQGPVLGSWKLISDAGTTASLRGLPTNPYPPLEYGGSGPDWKGEASRWDAESGLKVVGGVGWGGGEAFACGMAHNELLPSFCSSASQWEESLEGQITRAQRH